MPKVSWLDRIRQQLGQPRRKTASRRRPLIESLEHRELLSVSSLIVNNQLRIVADGDEAIAVQVDPSGNGRVQVLIDGTAVSTLAPLAASQLRGISIIAGQGDNLIDLNAITSADFSYADADTGLGLQIQVDAGNGNDTLFGSQDFEDSLMGGDGDDLINVTPTNTITAGQVIDGGDGNDTITGGDGDDSITGGDGFDSITGGAGNDSIQAGDGNDSVFGSGGDDEIHGNQGEDAINGGQGNDTIFGESGNDSLVGDAGDDSLLGGAGADDIAGDLGTAATPGNDTALGGSGNDLIRGNGGADLLVGGDGDDDVGVTQATLSISDVTITEGNAGDIVQANFIVTLSYELAVPVTVDATLESITASLGTDVTGLTRTLTFEPGTTSQLVTVPIISDSTQERTETFRVRLSNAVGAAISDNEGIGTITDDDAPPPSAFTIDVQFSSGLTPSQQATFSQAAQRIQAFIIGDVPDITVPGFGLIDDVVIDASGVSIDGVNGILGQAGPTGQRPGSFIPYAGVMQFDTADLASLEAAGELLDVITHEMMHVLGFGTIWTDLGLLVGAGSVAPTYIGSQATAEYNTRFNATGTSVPVEGSAAGPGSADGHWRESVFDNELMTPFYNSGQVNPISRVTVAQFADLGYQVNLGAAEPYLVANSSARSSARSTAVQRPMGRILAMTDHKTVGLPRNVEDVLPISFWHRTNSTSNSAAVVQSNSRTSEKEKARAAETDTSLTNVVNTITFDELPQQPINGLTVEGATFTYTINGVASSNATFNTPGANGFAYISGGVSLGDTSGVLTVDFANPVSNISFGVARSGVVPVNNGFSVELFDAGLNSLGVTTVPMAQVISPNIEGLYTSTASGISRMRIDFSVANSAVAGTQFALDNLVTDDSPTVAPVVGNATVIGGNGNDTLSGGDQADLLIGNAGDDLMASGGGDDILQGGAGSDTGFGGDGNDSLYGQGNRDALLGGAGNDLIDGGDSADLLYGDDLLNILSGNDTLIGGASDDTAFGGNGADLLYGGAGRDSLNGQAGNDTLYGQAGNDTLIGEAGDDTVQWRGDGNDSIDVGDGQDGVSYRGTTAADTVAIGQSGSSLTLTSNGATMTIAGKSEQVSSPVEAIVFDMLGGDDFVQINDINNVGVTSVIINGGNGNDVISGKGKLLGDVRLVVNGDDGDDRINGTNGAEEINGGLGNDLVNAGDGADIINGNAGDDTLNGGAGDDSLIGDLGADAISGGDGLDTLSGGDGADVLSGDNGDDVASGGADDDAITGGLGNDLLLGENGQDAISGGGGNDTLDGGRNNDTLSGNSGNDKIRGDHGDDLIAGGDGDDTIDGGDGADSINGGEGADAILAGDGDDSVQGGNGSDTIVGGDGNDTLLGGGGADILLGEDGDDIVNGNGATDIISGGEGTDIINDATAVIDENFVLTAALLTKLDASN